MIANRDYWLNVVPELGVCPSCVITPSPYRFAQDRFALDEASVRVSDVDGRLHVSLTNISKANVCPYLGREIPDAEQLGLDPEKVYNLLRDPEELAKAASTFNNLPLLSEHTPVSAEQHEPDLVIGSTGTDAAFVEPYLKNSLVVWVQKYIDLINKNRQKELSSAYRYRADMTPGVYEGERYDGVMRDIIGNHVALVKEGRAGPDVVVGDSKEEINMAKVLLSRKAAVAQGALLVYLQPKMAADAKINISSSLVGVTGENYTAKIPAIAQSLHTQLDGKLAKDEGITLGDLTEFLSTLNGVSPAEAPAEDADDPAAPPAKTDPDPAAPAAKADPDPAAPPAKTDPDPAAAPAEAAAPGEQDAPAEGEAAWDAEPLRQYLAGKLSAEDQAECDKLFPQQKAADEDDGAFDAEEDLNPKVEQPKVDPTEKDKDMVSSQAMDAALAANRKQVKKEMHEAAEAREFVRPFVGNLPIALDSAEEVLRAAAASLKIASAKTANEAALRELISLKGSALQSRETHTTQTTVAMDAADSDSFNAMFPDAARIRAN